MVLVHFFNERNIHKLTAKLSTRGPGSRITDLTPKSVIVLNGICEANHYSWLPMATPGSGNVPFVDLSELTKDWPETAGRTT
mgnify:CR=1 FL=1